MIDPNTARACGMIGWGIVAAVILAAFIHALLTRCDTPAPRPNTRRNPHA